MVAFPVLAAPTVVPVSKLTSEAIARCNLRDVEYVVLERPKAAYGYVLPVSRAWFAEPARGRW